METYLKSRWASRGQYSATAITPVSVTLLQPLQKQKYLMKSIENELGAERDRDILQIEVGEQRAVLSDHRYPSVRDYFATATKTKIFNEVH